MPQRPIITLLTDLGTTDAYVGIVKGVILARNREAQIVDLTHAVERGNLHAAGYLLSVALDYFPPAPCIWCSPIPALLRPSGCSPPASRTSS